MLITRPRMMHIDTVGVFYFCDCSGTSLSIVDTLGQEKCVPYYIREVSLF